MVRVSLLRAAFDQTRAQGIRKNNFLKIAVGWVSLIGLSIYSFSLVKEDALEKRREQLRIKKEITQKVYDEFEAETTKKNE